MWPAERNSVSGPGAWPRFVAVPGQRFLMGREHGAADEAPVHEVAVADCLAATEPVTNEQYARFLAAADATAPPFWSVGGFDHPGQPVVGVTWFEAVAYCEWMTEATGMRCRLPTEAERELAARGGRAGADWPWDGLAHPGAIVVDAGGAPHATMEACSNGLGLRCMADNVHEWCSDWYAADWYGRSPSIAPAGPESGVRRASRGGSWRHRVKVTRVTARSSLGPERRYADYGFRVFADVAVSS